MRDQSLAKPGRELRRTFCVQMVYVPEVGVMVGWIMAFVVERDAVRGCERLPEGDERLPVRRSQHIEEVATERWNDERDLYMVGAGERDEFGEERWLVATDDKRRAA